MNDVERLECKLRILTYVQNILDVGSSYAELSKLIDEPDANDAFIGLVECLGKVTTDSLVAVGEMVTSLMELEKQKLKDIPDKDKYPTPNVCRLGASR